jgi:nitrogen fixation protein NifU and related proteins
VSDLPQLYQDVVLDHNRRPRNFRALAGGRKAEGRNPLCGDHLTVYLRVDGDVIADVGFQASACAIAKASASLMTERVKGQTLADTRALLARFQQMIAAPPGGPIDDLGPLSALAGVRQFPTRVKCALLAWHALRAAMDARDEVVSTE